MQARLKKCIFPVLLEKNSRQFVCFRWSGNLYSSFAFALVWFGFGFLINFKKYVLTPLQEIEFLDLRNNSITLELSLNKMKIQEVTSECQNLLNNPQTSILELTKLIGLLTSTIEAVLPAGLNCRFLQMQQISSLLENLSYLDKIVLNENSKIELKRWAQNLNLCNGWALIQPLAEVLIHCVISVRIRSYSGPHFVAFGFSK